jgi:hypothetical protein
MGVRGGLAAALGAAILAAGTLLMAQAPAPQQAQPAIINVPSAGAGQVIMRVEPSADPVHRAALERLDASRALEDARGFFEAFRLPQSITFQIRACANTGWSGAWYQDNTINICHHYIANVAANAGRADRPAWVEEAASLRGQFLDVLIHEGAHAVFEQLKTPMLTKEEDAADNFATLVILNLFSADAVGLVSGIVHSYLVDAGVGDFDQMANARPRWPPNSQYGGAHSHPLQRVYNVVCLAYGFDEDRFDDLDTRSDMPAWRTNGCEDEYQQVKSAFIALIGPHIDAGKLKQRFPGTALLDNP